MDGRAIRRRVQLNCSCAKDDAEDIRLLLKDPATLEMVFEPDVGGLMPLHHAAVVGAARCVALLLEHGADANAATANGNRHTPLHIAAMNGRVEVLLLLLQHGADPGSVCAQGKTPLKYAHELQSPGVLRVLDPVTGDPGSNAHIVPVPEPVVPSGTYPDPLRLHYTCADSSATVHATAVDSCPTAEGRAVTEDSPLELRSVEAKMGTDRLYILARTEDAGAVFEDAVGRRSRTQTATPAPTASPSLHPTEASVLDGPHLDWDPFPRPHRGMRVFVRAVARTADGHWSDARCDGYFLLSPLEQFFESLPEAELRRYEGRFVHFGLVSLDSLMRADREVLHRAMARIGIPEPHRNGLVRALKSRWRWEQMRQQEAEDRRRRLGRSA